MPPIRVTIRSTDPETISAISAELEALRGQEPDGVELVDDPAPRTRAIDPQVAVVGLALVTGLATGAGTKLGEVVMSWLIERIRRIIKKRKERVSLKIAGVEFTVDEDTDPEALGSQINQALQAARE